MPTREHRLPGGVPGTERTLYDEEAETEAVEAARLAELEEERKRGVGAEHETGNAHQQNGASPVVEYDDSEDEVALRSAIFSTSDVVEVIIAVPEWKIKGRDGKERIARVLIRALSARERAQFLNAQNAQKFDLVKAYPDLVILTARHPVTKKLLFKAEDRNALLQKAGRAIERIALKAGDISGLSEEALAEMKKN